MGQAPGVRWPDRLAVAERSEAFGSRRPGPLRLGRIFDWRATGKQVGIRLDGHSWRGSATFGGLRNLGRFGGDRTTGVGQFPSVRIALDDGLIQEHRTRDSCIQRANGATHRDSHEQVAASPDRRAEALAFAADGKVKADIELQPLSAINQVFERLAKGEVPSRVVLDFSPR